MFPIRDNNPSHSTAYVTIALIIANVAIFVLQLSQPGDGSNRITWKYGFVPAEFVTSEKEFNAGLERNPPPKVATDRLGRPLINPFTRQPILEPDIAAMRAAEAVPATINIFTCMFLHGGWMHLIGNMLFLWIFGNNVEDRLGPVLFLIFYLATGVCGNLMHTFFEPSFVPLVGASGAISGVMGGYLLLFPRARILAVVPIGYYPATFSLPAWIYLAFYFVMQNLYPASFGSGSHVAYWAHIGGFISGVAMILVLPKRKQTTPPPVYDPRADDADFVL
ncbi:MAG: rhomboid family intramembrane serine protease [Planctomycetes bacterium]|nr:rhomboid family intramembrane serine protease [Planctomycetota bacterium]